MAAKSIVQIFEEDRVKNRNIRFGRDYYVRQAAKATGSRSKLVNTEDKEDQEEVDWSSEQNDSASQEHIVHAKVALVDSDSQQQDSLKPNTLELSSDSDWSLERVYNLETGEIIEKIGDIRREIKQKPDSPEGIKYTHKNDEFDPEYRVSSKCETDENHNNTFHKITSTYNKKQFLQSLTQSEDVADGLKCSEPKSNNSNSNSNISDNVPYEDVANVQDAIIPEDTSNIKNNLLNKKLPNSISHQNILQKNVGKLDKSLESEILQRSKSGNAIDKIVTVEEKEIVEKFRDIIETSNSSDVIASDSRDDKMLPNNTPNSRDVPQNTTISTTLPPDSTESLEFSLEYSSNNEEEDQTFSISSFFDTDSEIIDLKEKKLVKNILGELTRTYPKVSAVSHTKKQEQEEFSIEAPSMGKEEIQAPDDNVPSVQVLKKIFAKTESGKKDLSLQNQVHSLTARSIPQQFRRELREKSSESELPPSTTESLNTVSQQDSEELQREEEVDFPTAKSKIEFYENLKR